jgi:hypothetical protein
MSVLFYNIHLLTSWTNGVTVVNSQQQKGRHIFIDVKLTKMPHFLPTYYKGPKWSIKKIKQTNLINAVDKLVNFSRYVKRATVKCNSELNLDIILQ